MSETSILNCTRCGLCKTRKQVVPGTGTGTSGIMFVGEAPGKTENANGVPFVGRAGQLLREVIPLFWSRDIDDLYITNVLKCWPCTPDLKGNRTPKAEEFTACAPWLELEIQKLRPTIIIPLGDTALKRITKEGGIGTKHGQAVWMEQYHAVVYPMYHPAYILRNRQETALEEDSRRLGAMIHQPWWEVERWLKTQTRKL